MIYLSQTKIQNDSRRPFSECNSAASLPILRQVGGRSLQRYYSIESLLFHNLQSFIVNLLPGIINILAWNVIWHYDLITVEGNFFSSSEIPSSSSLFRIVLSIIHFHSLVLFYLIRFWWTALEFHVSFIFWETINITRIRFIFLFEWISLIVHRDKMGQIRKKVSWRSNSPLPTSGKNFKRVGQYKQKKKSRREQEERGAGVSFDLRIPPST